MKRYSIRDRSSSKNVKPRICDLLVHENGKMQIEVSGKRGMQTIDLEDLEEQIDEIKHEKI